LLLVSGAENKYQRNSNWVLNYKLPFEHWTTKNTDWGRNWERTVKRTKFRLTKLPKILMQVEDCGVWKSGECERVETVAFGKCEDTGEVLGGCERVETVAFGSCEDTREVLGGC
jgi:hypothetical protein